MALQNTSCFLTRSSSLLPVVPAGASSSSTAAKRRRSSNSVLSTRSSSSSWWSGRRGVNEEGKAVWSRNASSSNYVIPLDNASLALARPLDEILRDLNKRVPHGLIDSPSNLIPWYHANRMLSFYAPGWCGNISDVIFSENGSVTVIYRITIRGSDREAHRESSGTVALADSSIKDPVAAAEEIAFCRACARFGLGLYLYHEDEKEQ